MALCFHHVLKIILKSITTLNADDTKSNAKKAKDPSNSDKPVAHFKPKIYFSMLTDLFLVGPEDVPPEMAKLFRINQEQQFLPIVQNDFLQTRLVDLVHITKDTKSLPLTVKYKPMGIGKMRLLLHMQHAMLSLKRLGFSTKDLDDIKGAFSDTNIYLLCGTIIVSSVHVSIYCERSLVALNNLSLADFSSSSTSSPSRMI